MSYKIDTNCIHAGYEPQSGEPRVVPIYQSTTFKYDSAEDMSKLFDLDDNRPFYTRLGNPTTTAVEAKIAALEGGVGALLTASGQAASLFSILNICSAGDHVISSTSIYGGTFNLFNNTLRKLGIAFTFVSPDASAQELDAAFEPNTKAVFGETIANPALTVLDIETFAAAAHRHNVPLIIDNTFATPINCRPFEFGADIIVHSTSKYLDGHACALGGVIVDSGNFDWTKGDYPMLTTPDESYHGMIYAEKFGKAAFIIKARTHMMRDMGATPSPMNAFLLDLGLTTLALRMERHCRNAEQVAAYLEANEHVSWVNYPSLPGSKYYALAQKYLPNVSCGVISFGVKGGRSAAVQFMDALKLASIVTHVADARTCVLHPASTTHRQLTDEQLESSGVKPELIRLSVGIENAQDIIDDLRQSLDQI